MRLIHGPDALASTDDATKDDVAKEECGLLGIVGEISHWEWTLTRADDPWKVVAALCAALVGVSLTLWLSRRERTSGHARAPLFGTSLRCATWILLALVTLGPARVRVEQHAILPIVSVLRDVSMSVDPALMKQAQITTLAGRADTSVHDFSRGVHPETSAERQKSRRENSADDDATSPRSGKATDIALALRQTADLDHPAAIILLSDGRTTVGDDPLVVARELGERGVPIFAVGVGEATPRRGVRLVSVESRSQVWKDEPFVVEVSLESLSATQQSVSLRLSKISSGNEPGTEVARAQATLDRSKGRVRHEFRIQENVPGRYVYRVEVRRRRIARIVNHGCHNCFDGDETDRPRIGARHGGRAGSTASARHRGGTDLGLSASGTLVGTRTDARKYLLVAVGRRRASVHRHSAARRASRLA